MSLNHFPLVSYLDHDFTLEPHPHVQDLHCVAHEGTPVSNEHEDKWLLARRLGITASGFGELVTRANTPSKSRSKVIESKVLGQERDLSFVEAFKLGREFEPMIAERVKTEYDIDANHWLVAHTDTPRFLATPDGLSHDMAAEYKTSTKSWGANIHSYYRQIQWQLYVTNREQSVFAVLHPHTKKFMAGVVPRDDEEIEILHNVASEVLQEMDAFAQTDRYLSREPARTTVRSVPVADDDFFVVSYDEVPF